MVAFPDPRGELVEMPLVCISDCGAVVITAGSVSPVLVKLEFMGESKPFVPSRRVGCGIIVTAWPFLSQNVVTRPRGWQTGL